MKKQQNDYITAQVKATAEAAIEALADKLLYLLGTAFNGTFDRYDAIEMAMEELANYFGEGT